MRLDDLRLVLRPRSMLEAADLGVRLVQADAGSVWRTFVPVYACAFALSMATADIAPWLPTVVLFWCKPWLDRSLLFVLARAVFGTPTRIADLWRARAEVLFLRPLRTFTTMRLSPWRGFTMPLDQLERLSGAELVARRRVVLRGQGKNGALLQFAFGNIEIALSLGLVACMVWLVPDGRDSEFLAWLARQAGSPLAIVPYAATVLFLEPFFVGAGFAMYLNRRVQLEAWDIEQEFRHVFA